MKKIILATIAILMTGMFAGCASLKMTGTQKSLREHNIQRIQEELGEEWAKEYEKVYDKYVFIDESEIEDEIFNDLRKILDKPVITKTDLAYIRFLPYNPSFPVRDITKMPSSKIQRSTFTGRIINKTDKPIKLYFSTDEPGILRTITIQPDEAGYFSFPIIRHKSLNRFKDRYFFVEIDGKRERFLHINEDHIHEPNTGRDENAIYLPICEEIVKSHSLELIYDGYHSTRLCDLLLNYDLKFIEPFDYEWED